MERLTEYHAGVAVIKDKAQQKKAMAKLAAYENTGLTPREITDGKMLTGWIAVEERLPEENARILATIKHHKWTSDYDSDPVPEGLLRREIEIATYSHSQTVAEYVEYINNKR